jgi:ATP-dependent helicase HrpB
MSATLDVGAWCSAARPAARDRELGRGFPIDIRYQDRPAGERIEDAVTRAIVEAHRTESGSILAFLPGQAEIGRTAARLQGRFDDRDADCAALRQSQPEGTGRGHPAALPGTRKIVLATSIAETSITIDGVRIVIDSGLQRLPVFEASTGITRLETVRVSRASADQRAGRAGRTEPGIAIRLWHQGQTAAHAGIHAATDSVDRPVRPGARSRALGRSGYANARLHRPAAGDDACEARALLKQLGALDPTGALNARGKVMRDMALPPRLAAMVISSGETGHARDAAMLAVLLTEQGLGGTEHRSRGPDATVQIRTRRASRGGAPAGGRLAKGLDLCKAAEPCWPAAPACMPFPIGSRCSAAARGSFRDGERTRRRTAGDRATGEQPMLVIADLTGRAAQARILAAAEVTRGDVEAELPGEIRTDDQTFFDRQSRQVRARRATRLGPSSSTRRPCPGLPASGDEGACRRRARAWTGALPFSKEARQLRERIGFLYRSIGVPWPDVERRRCFPHGRLVHSLPDGCARAFRYFGKRAFERSDGAGAA